MHAQAFKEMFGFGAGRVGRRVPHRRAQIAPANFVIGKALGTAALGYFEKGYEPDESSSAGISATRVNRVLFPVFARIRHEPGRFRSAVRRTILSVSLIGYPVFVSLIVLAPQIIYVLFGSQWAPAVLPFQILCVTGIPRLILELMIVATFVTGSSRTEMKRRTAMAVLTLWAPSWRPVGPGWRGDRGRDRDMIGLISAVWQVHRLGLLRPLADVLKPQSIPLRRRPRHGRGRARMPGLGAVDGSERRSSCSGRSRWRPARRRI